VKFGFDKIEFSFSNLSQAFFEAMPKTIGELTAWIIKVVPDFKFASHTFSYFSHSFVEDSTPQEVLKAVNARELKSAGISVGSGTSLTTRFQAETGKPSCQLTSLGTLRAGCSSV